jgi:hypothetical protein
MTVPADPSYAELWALAAALSEMVDDAQADGFFSDRALTCRQVEVLAMVDHREAGAA